MKILRVLVILLMFCNVAVPKETQEYMYIKEELITALRDSGCDIEAKSIKGWIRIFNSDDRLEDYGIYISEKQRIIFLSYFKHKLEAKQNRYKREIK